MRHRVQYALRRFGGAPARLTRSFAAVVLAVLLSSCTRYIGVKTMTVPIGDPDPSVTKTLKSLAIDHRLPSLENRKLRVIVTGTFEEEKHITQMVSIREVECTAP